MSKKQFPDRIGATHRIGTRLSSRIEAVIGTLAASEQERLIRRQHTLAELYASWADTFESLKASFADLWDVLGEMEQCLVSWRRVSQAEGKEGKWGPLALSKRGYAFSAGLVLGEDPTARKWLIVNFAHGDSTQDGMGDERIFGFRGAPSEMLVGLADCSRVPDDRVLEQAELLVQRIDTYDFVFDLHHLSLGQRRFKVPRHRVGDRSLTDLVTALFVALNNDDLEKLNVLGASLARSSLGIEG